MDSSSETRDHEEDNSSVNKYKKIISSLPKRECWGGTLHQYQGFWYHPDYILGMMLAQQNFKPKSSDIILCSFPKSGTTWLKALAFAIVTRSSFLTHPSTNNNPLLTSMPHECVPFVEVNNTCAHNLKLPLFATHSSYTSLPHSVTSSDCKIVYICRDPKDVMISLWYFFKNFTFVNDEKYPSLEQGLELFCEGYVSAGPFWEHVLGFWRASLEFPKKVLFLQYEEMKKDIVGAVRRLAEFMGYPFSAEEEKQGLVHKIIKLCSFQSLSDLDVSKNGEQFPNSQFTVPNSSFYRKGEVGDWKNHLTQAMADRFDQITEQKLSCFGFKFMSS